jgi:alpha-N-acetylglucosaminidase
MRIPLLVAALAAASAAHAGDFPGAEGIVGRRVPWLQGHVRFERLGGTRSDSFEIAPGDGGVVIRASGANAAAAGLGWYLKYYCHRSMSHLGDNLSDPHSIPEVARPFRADSWARLRYALNYCTFNYTMSFYSWDDWQHELDWMALSGVNLMLVANGEEAVWRNTMRALGYGEADIAAFIPGPACTAWWLMGNLEGTGGPMSGAMIDRRADAKRRILARMRELGIEPLMPGFYGMVPAAMAARSKAHIVTQGLWSGFNRPAILDPTDPEFGRVAAVYYGEVKKLYGDGFTYFSGDPFHEGGIMEGVDLGRAGKAVQDAMTRSFPGAVWVLQGWLENPRKELIASADKSHVLVQELFGEQTSNWEKRGAYEGTPFVWCCIDNFGERPVIFGPLRRFCDEVERARTGPFAKYLQGTGIMPEGIANNPAAYDLALELSWHADHVDPSKWIGGYEAYRYGAADDAVAEAWKGLLATAYGGSGGGPEPVLCARPEDPPGPASHWASLDVPYDPAAFEAAVAKFESAAPRFASSETYRIDLATFRLQVIYNRALVAARGASAAMGRRDRQAFEGSAARLLGLGGDAERILGAEPVFSLRSYQERALAYGRTDAERRQCLRDAIALVTYWAGDSRGEGELHDCAFKALAGMMDSYSVGRWREYYADVRLNRPDTASARPDFFSWERRWADANSDPARLSGP